ncbi:MAG: TetR/AcrR family transcriptional regulator [Thermodesulfobacteriota bacterium]
MEATGRYLSAEERREVTVEAVIELAGERNPSEITTAAIAGRMGLTQGALFRHFANKDAILQAVMEWVAHRLLARVDQAVSQAATPLAALEGMFMTHVDFVVTYPGIPRILFGELQRAGETAARRVAQGLILSYGARLTEVVDRGKQCGELDAGLDTEAAVTLFIGTIQGLVVQALLAGDVGRIRREAPGVFAVYRRGIRRAS